MVKNRKCDVLSLKSHEKMQEIQGNSELDIIDEGEVTNQQQVNEYLHMVDLNSWENIWMTT